MDITYHVYSRPEFTELHRQTLAQFLQLQGKITGNLTTKLDRCFFIVIAYQENQPVAIAALKNPTPDAFTKADLSSQEYDIPYELGYVYVSDSARGQGVSKELVSRLIEQAPNASLMAITEITSNIPMVKTLERAGFKHVGNTWRGVRAQTPLGLMIKNKTE